MCSGISNHTWPTLKDSAERDNDLLRLNNNPKRKSYNLFNNHCGTFGFDVINQDPNINLPTIHKKKALYSAAFFFEKYLNNNIDLL